jgi:uncharacterized RDD family membrane protein YckC
MDARALRQPIDTIAVVETPEHIRFRYRTAGPAQRAVAYAIDLVVRGMIASFLAVVALIADVVPGATTGLVLIGLFLLEWGYYVLLETLMGGRSFGKRALRLRVVRQDGRPLGFGDSLLRNLLRAADFLPLGYAIGLVVMSRDPLFRRLGDMVAGTIVVSEQAPRASRASSTMAPPSAKELARLPERLELTAAEIEAIELFLHREGELSPVRQDELAEIVAPVFARRMQLRYKSAARLLALLHHRATGRGP